MVLKNTASQDTDERAMLMVLSITAVFGAVILPLYFASRKDTATLPVQLSIALVVSGVLELFDLLALYNPAQLYYWKKYSLISEAALLPVWFWFALTYARQGGVRTIYMPLRFMLAASPFLAIFACIVPISLFIDSHDVGVHNVLHLTNYGYAFYLVVLVYLVSALIQLEQTFVLTTGSARWRIKFEILGAGTFLAILIIYYSQGLLFHSINMGLNPMRAVVLMAAIAMIFYSHFKRWDGVVTIHISQQVACKSAVLLAVGMYIIFLGLVGQGMKYFGNDFQRSLIFAFAVFTGLGLLIILLSETAKRRITVFIHRNFFQNKYDYRTQWLQITDRLSESQSKESLKHSIISEFCYTFGMGTGVLFMINQERDSYHQAAVIGMEHNESTFSTNDPDIQLLCSSRWITDVRNNISETENSPHRELFTRLDACFMIPLFINDSMDGFIILGRPHSSEEIYTYEDFDLMRTLAKQASLALQNLHLSDQLAYSRELAAIGKVSTFVMHDLKNLVSTVSLLLENAQEHINEPAFQNDLLMSLGNTVIKMRSIISRLKHLPEKNSLQLSSVNLLQMVQDTAAMVTGKTLEVTGTSVIAEADREELQKVTLNLMLNAVEATEGNAPVKVEVGENGSPFIRVKDKGCGIPAAFMQHVLFKPFSSTKKQGMGIGLYQSRQIIEAHGGRIEVESSTMGSEFTVWLPKMHTEAA